MDITDVNTRLRSLSPAKRALLEQRLKQSATQVLSAPSIPRRQARDSAPLSFAQQRMWFLSQLEPEGSSYNEASAIRLRGPLHVDALHGAFNQLLARHEVLRTTFSTVADEPRQFVMQQSVLDIPVIDLQEVPSDQRDAELQNTLLKFIKRPFDLSRDLPLRVLLVRLGDEEHILLKVIHHIASDGWSSAIIWRELEKYYRDALVGTRSDIAELPIQYQDYAEWQRQWLRGEVLEEQLSYWKKQLDGVEPLHLPFDRPRIPGKKSAAARAFCDLDAELTESLRGLSKKHGVTLFMTMLAAYQALLHRYTGQEDIVVGSPIAGRTRPEVENLIGFFVNTLVLRGDTSGNPTFEELLMRVRNVALEAYSHQDLAFEKLVEELNPVRDLETPPLFQILFAHQNVPRSPINLAGVESSLVGVSNGEAKFDLFVAVRDIDVGSRLSVEYATDLFDATSIERMLKNFATLLVSVAANPNQRLSELAILKEAEKRQLLVEWNDTQSDYPKDQCVHQLFQEQVERTPDAIAVSFDGQELTYRELNSRANQLARYLQQHGVTAQTYVAICMERGIDMTVAVLGALKAGAAYVPLDPEYPKDRLAFMLHDVQATLLLTENRLIESERWRIADSDPQSSILEPQLKLVCLDRDWSAIETQSAENPECLVSSDQPAYVIYTSGSTGKPKGVVMEHRSLSNLIAWQIDHPPFPPQARTLQFASLSFDVSFQEMLSTWCSGGTLVLLPGEIRRDPIALLGYLTANKVERIFLPFVVLQQLADFAQMEGLLPTQLREVITAGEQLQITPQIRSFFQQLPDCRLVNQYGPTESHVVTAFTLAESVKDWPALPPIGRPIQNASMYILDRKCCPVPIGVAGELYIGGAGVAREYLNRPDLTAERFIQHSFDGGPSQRLYRTGDLARYLPDGNIEFLGRGDNQVKIRGYRIEPEEIEAVLAQHPAVRECAVIAVRPPKAESDALKSKIENPGWDRRLVAYAVQNPAVPASVGELRDFLRQKLPEYMVPSVFVILDALPLTPNGKVDRKALPAPEQSRPEMVESYQAPRTATEEMLAGIWAEVLNLDRVGTHDNFFDLGGHSLLATQVASRIRNSFRIDFPLRRIFETPTIAGLAEWMEKAKSTGSSADLPGIVALPRRARILNSSPKS